MEKACGKDLIIMPLDMNGNGMNGNGLNGNGMSGNGIDIMPDSSELEELLKEFN